MNIVIQDSTKFEGSDLSYAFCCDEKSIGMPVRLYLSHIIITFPIQNIIHSSFIK